MSDTKDIKAIEDISRLYHTMEGNQWKGKR